LAATVQSELFLGFIGLNSPKRCLEKTQQPGPGMDVEVVLIPVVIPATVTSAGRFSCPALETRGTPQSHYKHCKKIATHVTWTFSFSLLRLLLSVEKNGK
jgi:hypothetical protein